MFLGCPSVHPFIRAECFILKCLSYFDYLHNVKTSDVFAIEHVHEKPSQVKLPDKEKNLHRETQIEAQKVVQ